MTASKVRTIDLLTGAFDLNQRRKFTVNKPDGTPLCDLYFKPITRSDRMAVQAYAGSEDAVKISTQMLVQKAENEDGTPAFGQGDAVRLRRELPESVLNELELFLFGVNTDSLEDVKEN
tara:strand:+ start:15 stop:371 length:357 start_codon:yes stop_codon:yes gene_type:complete